MNQIRLGEDCIVVIPPAQFHFAKKQTGTGVLDRV